MPPAFHLDRLAVPAAASGAATRHRWLSARRLGRQQPPPSVTPAKAGVHSSTTLPVAAWIPAFAGMTTRGLSRWVQAPAGYGAWRAAVNMPQPPPVTLAK